MDNVYTGIELGTNSIKIVVMEKHENSYHTLASVSSISKGIRNGEVVDIKQAASAVRNAVKNINDILGFKITKVIAAIKATDCKMDIYYGSCDVVDYEKISGEDISNVINDALNGRINPEYEVVTACPISFKIDEAENIRDPKGLAGKSISSKVVVSTIPKEPLYRILEVLRLSGLETVDICYCTIGDYFTCKNKKRDNEVGAIINIGEESTEVSIFNKGIMIKNSNIPMGSINVDKDLSFIFNTELEESRRIKESFSISVGSYADINEITTIKLKTGETKEVNQVEVSNVVQARLSEMLKLAKNELKNLTNREISYIIVTGGLSEIAGFQYIVDNVFELKAKVSNINIMGIRHNKYSSALGVVKYYDEKLALRGKSNSLINNENRDYLIGANKKEVTNENIINKVFEHFFDN